MATMIPSTVHDDCKSSAEKRVSEKTVTRILSGGVAPTDIVILSRYKKKKSALKGIESIGGFPLIHFEAATKGQRALRYSTIQKFKGLEAKVVIVTDVTDLQSEFHKVLNYVHILAQTGHPFWLKPATHSDGNRPPILVQTRPFW